MYYGGASQTKRFPGLDNYSRTKIFRIRRNCLEKVGQNIIQNLRTVDDTLPLQFGLVSYFNLSAIVNLMRLLGRNDCRIGRHRTVVHRR